MNETKATMENGIKTICKNDLHEIPISSLYISPVNTDFSMKGIEDLSNSISVSGLLQPLAVAGPDEENRYEVLAGARRLTAILKARETHPDFMENVSCNVVLDANASDTEKAIAVEDANIYNRDDIDSNFHRKKMIRLFKKYETEIYEGEDGKPKENTIRLNVVERAKDYFRVEPRYALMFYNIFGQEGNEDIEQLLDDKKVYITQADKIVHMDEQTRKSVVDDINNGTSSREALKPYIKKRNSATTAPQNEAETKESVTNQLKAEETSPMDQFTGNTQTHKTTIPDAREMYATVSKNLDIESEDDCFGDDTIGLEGAYHDHFLTDISVDDVSSFLENLLLKDYLEDEDYRIVSLCQDIVAKFED